jgi:peptide/nickel transport system permease protein
LGFGAIILFVVCGLFAGIIAPYDPADQNIQNTLQPPVLFEGGSPKHLLGTDEMGRDVLSRIVYGARISLIVGFVAVILSGLVGGYLGLVSGYFGGVVDAAIMRLVDIQLSLPAILLGLAIIGAVGPSLQNIIIVIAITTWADYARVIRGQVLSVKTYDFVDLAKVTGCSTPRILLRHILPSVFNSIVVIGTLMLGRVIILESALSFLGLGVQPPTPSWGTMLADGRQYLNYAWWLSTFPGLAIMLVVLGTNLVGDWLRAVLDPKLRSAMK